MNKIIIILLVTVVCGDLQAQKAARRAVAPKVRCITTAKDQPGRMQESATLSFEGFSQPLETQPCIFIDPARQFQEFIGIGAALTDASAETFAKLTPALQSELLTAYFDTQKGIGYTIGRTNIHSCDFSSGSYTYVQEGDKSLSTFSVAHDEEYRIPFIKKAMAAANGKMKLYVSPWSPPAWMKDNNSMLQGGKLKPEYAQTWANYYIKFIKTYEAKGIPVWGLTVQNEPMAKQRWESCIYSAEDERDFIKTYLGPTLWKNNMQAKKLIAWDHNRDLLYHRASVILNDPEAAKYVWGIGFHWYETWTGSSMQFDNLQLVSKAFPSKQLIFTEGCKEKFDMDSVNNWSLGEKYAYSMINDFNNGTAAWTDWNILLDGNGGPNHVGNFCFAPVHSSKQYDKLIYTNAYYYIGHFSKYIRPGAKRIAASSSRTSVQTTAFKNTDGSIVVIVLNNTDKEQEYRLWMNGTAALTKSLPHSINTFIIQ